MAVEVVFPATDLTTSVGQVTKWLKSEGEDVKKGEVLAEVQTEKVVFEVESPASGILAKILVPTGIEVPVLTVIAVVTAVGEKVPEKYLVHVSAGQPTTAADARVGGTASANFAERRSETMVVAVPLVRKLAAESGIDLRAIRGSGPGGRILKEDVSRAIEGKSQASQLGLTADTLEDAVAPLSPMRKVIALRMSESFRSPHFYLTVEADAQQLAEMRRQLMPSVEKKTGIKLTYTDLVIKSAARSLADNPSVNCYYADGSVKVSKRIDIGVVVSVEGGLLVPVIKQADRKSLPEIVQARDALARKARERKLTADEMKGSTFTISNLGMFGVDWFSAILQPPEAAILAVGRIAERAVVRGGQVVSRLTVVLTLSIDHRVLDGVLGAQFLQSLKDYIENPVTLME